MVNTGAASAPVNVVGKEVQIKNNNDTIIKPHCMPDVHYI